MSKDEKLNGLKIAMDILDQYPEEKREKLLTNISKKSPQVAKRIKEEYFSFDDIKDLDSKSMQIIITKANHLDLVVALSDAKLEIKNYFFANMSERKLEMIKEDLSTLGESSSAKIFTAQKNILDLIDNLRKSGLVKIKNSALGITV